MGQMQAAFTDNWIKTGRSSLRRRDFPQLEPMDDMIAQVFKSSKARRE